MKGLAGEGTAALVQRGFAPRRFGLQRRILGTQLGRFGADLGLAGDLQVDRRKLGRTAGGILFMAERAHDGDHPGRQEQA